MEIGIFIYDGVEVLDFAGPFEVFNTANRLAEQAIRVSLIAPSQAPVTARGGLSVNPHYSIHAHPRFDLLIVAGGEHFEVIKSPAVLHWLAETANHTPECASVCTGVFVFAEAGIIDGKTVTTHWEDIKALNCTYPALNVVDNARFIRDQNFTSSAGISAGIDMSLALVARKFGAQLAKLTAKQMEYEWAQNP